MDITIRRSGALLVITLLSACAMFSDDAAVSTPDTAPADRKTSTAPTEASATTTEPTYTSESTSTTEGPSSDFEKLTLAAVGDWYEDDPSDEGFVEDALSTRDAMIDVRPDMILGLGDFSYGLRDPTELFEFLRPLETTAPIYPTFGNHDGISEGEIEKPNFYTSLLDHFGTDEFYAIDRGPIRFISVNSEYVTSSKRHGDQLEFVTKTLEDAETDPAIRLVIPFFHNAMVNPLSPNGPDPLLQETYYPLLERSSKVRLAVQANHHIYTRTHAVRQLPSRDETKCRDDGSLCQAFYEVLDHGVGEGPVVYMERQGIIFVTVGTGGAHATGLTPPMDYMAVRHKPVSTTETGDGGTFGFLYMQIDLLENIIEGQFLANNGEQLDWFEIEFGGLDS